MIKFQSEVVIFQMGQFVIDKHFGCNNTMDLVLLDTLLKGVIHKYHL